MAVVRYAGDRYTGLSTDAKPSDILAGAIFLETDTAESYFYNGSSWTLITGGGLEEADNATITGDWNWTGLLTIQGNRLLVTAGNGLERGDVNGYAEVALGTPSTLNGLTGNVTTSNSHTHALTTTGADAALVSGTAGTAGNLLEWDANGDAIDSGISSSSIGGLSSVVEDTTPQLGGTLDANGNDIDLGVNHLICDQRIAEHAGDSDTWMEFGSLNTIEFHAGNTEVMRVTSTQLNLYRDIDLSFSHLICEARIAEHKYDTNTYIDFPAADQWSVTVGGTSMLEVGTSGVDIDGHCRYRADITNVGTGTGTTTIGDAQTGNSYYAPTAFPGTRSFQLNSATVGTHIQVFRNGAGIVQFTQGTSQTIIQGNNWKLSDKKAAHAVCVATNTWFVTGDGGA